MLEKELIAARDTRSKLRIRLAAVQRSMMWHCFSGITPHYLVTEYPRSGGSWLSQMLAAYLDVPFPRNERPPLLSWQSCLLHGHHLYSRRFKNVVCLIRDGRDVMASAYYYLLFENDRTNPQIAQQIRRRLAFTDYNDVRANMPAFIEYLFVNRLHGGFRVTWNEFVRSWIDKDANLITYEQLLRDTPGTLCKVIQRITQGEPDMDRLRTIVAKLSFANQARRNPGEEDRGSFLRKGIAGDWKCKFTKEACEVFDRYAGDTLIRAGYEKDRSWIESTEPLAAAPVTRDLAESSRRKAVA